VVNGLTYESKRWRFGIFTSLSREEAVQSLIRDIDPINPLVFYDPEYPARSCLVPGPNAMTLVQPILTSIFVLAMVVGGALGKLELTVRSG
jgi:hypothetical protein